MKNIQKVEALREAVLHVVLLDLQKAYDALYMSRCLGILKGYGVGTRYLRLLQRYWERLNIVAWAGGYYGSPFRREIERGHPGRPTVADHFQCGVGSGVL